MTPPFQLAVPSQPSLSPLPPLDDRYVIDPNFDRGCQGVSSGWTCDGGTTISGNIATLSPEGASTVSRLARDFGDDPPAGNFTLYFTILALAGGAGLRFRTIDDRIFGPWGAGQHELTFSVDGAVQTAQFETYSGSGTWQLSWVSSIQPFP